MLEKLLHNRQCHTSAPIVFMANTVKELHAASLFCKYCLQQPTLQHASLCAQEHWVIKSQTVYMDP